MITVNVSLNELPFRLQQFGDQVPYATSLALNDAAFGLMREEKTELRSQLTLRNTWTERGQKVAKSTKRTLEAETGSDRWYVESLIDGSTRRARDGLRYQGKRYLIVPFPQMKTRTGRLKKQPKSHEPIVFDTDKGMLLAYRSPRGKLTYVGIMVLETDYDEKTYDHEGVAEDYLDKHWSKHWLDAMERAALTAR